MQHSFEVKCVKNYREGNKQHIAFAQPGRVHFTLVLSADAPGVEDYTPGGSYDLSLSGAMDLAEKEGIEPIAEHVEKAEKSPAKKAAPRKKASKKAANPKEPKS